MIKVLKRLRDEGNTVVVVEHDEMMMREADYIIDMGPMASHLGGEVVAVGNYDEIVDNPESLTGKYLTGKLSIDPQNSVRRGNLRRMGENTSRKNTKNTQVTFS